MNPGILYAALAYTLWGVFPLYFQRISALPPLEIVLHRSVWSLALIAIVLTALRRWAWLGPVLRRPRLAGIFFASALLLSANWLTFVWAVNNHHVIDSSLGYFINPLFNVLVGALVLHERLRRAQWLSIGLAAAGVVWLAALTGHVPWIALFLAATFCGYGLLRKTAPLGALEGLALETMMLAPFGIVLLGWWTWQGTSALATNSDPALIAWLMLAGPFTAIPLLLFAAGARRISFATLGLLQYIGPTIQFGLGLWVYHEPFDGTRLVGFALIWTALAIYSVESGWAMRRTRLAVASIPSNR